MTLGTRVDQTPYVTLGGQGLEYSVQPGLRGLGGGTGQKRPSVHALPGPLALPASSVSALSDSEDSHDALCVCACPQGIPPSKH